MSLKNGTLFIGKKNVDDIQVGVIYTIELCHFIANLVVENSAEIILQGTKDGLAEKVQEYLDNGILEEYIKEESEPKTCMGCINSDICKHKNTVAKIEEQLGEDIKGAGISLQLICNRKRSLAPNPTIDTPYTPYIGSVELCPRWDTTCPSFNNGRCLSQLGCTKDIEFLKK